MAGTLEAEGQKGTEVEGGSGRDKEGRSQQSARNEVAGLAKGLGHVLFPVSHPLCPFIVHLCSESHPRLSLLFRLAPVPRSPNDQLPPPLASCGREGVGQGRGSKGRSQRAGHPGKLVAGSNRRRLLLAGRKVSSWLCFLPELHTDLKRRPASL